MAFTITTAGNTNIGGRHNRENQDCFFVSASQRTVGVFDGHGRDMGRAAATLARDTVAGVAAVDTGDLVEMVGVADRAVVALTSDTMGGRRSGTTATLMRVEDDGSCTVVHVGDSDVRVFDSDEGDGFPLMEDHSATSLSEYQRIAAADVDANFMYQPIPGSYFHKKPVFVTADDGTVTRDEHGYYYGNIHKKWAAYIYSEAGQALAVTRSLGDIEMRACGVIATPSRLTAPLPAETTRAIVVGSDGFWDAMPYAVVRETVRRFIGQPEAAAAALMDAALTAGRKVFGSSSDNLTVVVTYVVRN